MATTIEKPPTEVSGSDFPFTYEVLPLKQLIVDTYQRPLTSFVQRIVKAFDPALIGTIIVSKRSAKSYAIIDGQTRVEGMKEVGLKDAPCLVYVGLTPAQEADLFAKFQTERRGMHSASRFNAEVLAGREHAVAVNDIVEECGFKVNTTLNGDSRHIAAVAALEFAYWGARTGKGKEPDPELLAQTLLLIKKTWPKLPELARGALIIRGLAYFLSNNPDVDEEKFAAKLSKVQPSELGKRAQALKEGRGMTGQSPALMAEAIENLYRKR